jgi:hypothetical protein
MAAISATKADLRLPADDLKGRLLAGQPETILDVRVEKAYVSSDRRIRGDLRVNAQDFRIDPSWPRERLTVAYCT